MPTPPTYIEINRNALKRNAENWVAHLAPRTPIWAVKANAYGHGLAEVVSILQEYSNVFQIDDLTELVRFRSFDTTSRCLVLGYLAPHEISLLFTHNAEMAVFSLEQIDTLEKLAPSTPHMPVWLAFDAAFGREGMSHDELLAAATRLLTISNVTILGMYSHFSSMDDEGGLEKSAQQIESFSHAVESLQSLVPYPMQTHFASSSSALRWLPYDLLKTSYARIGISAYGIFPSDSIANEATIDLTPCVRFVSTVAQVKTISKGEPVGYGQTWRAPKDTTVCVLPVGYSDGMPRAHGEKGVVLINGTRCPFRGRISMNMSVVEWTGEGAVTVGDEVVLLGRQRDENLSAEEVASWSNTIAYEVVTRLSGLLPRVVV